jgi:hypothetical protein
MANIEDDRFPVLLERRLKMRRPPNAEETEIVVEIGYPYSRDQGLQAACPVAFRGDIGRVHDIHGIDPMHAVKSAILFTESYLRPGGNARFYWPDGDVFSMDGT